MFHQNIHVNVFMYTGRVLQSQYPYHLISTTYLYIQLLIGPFTMVTLMTSNTIFYTSAHVIFNKCCIVSVTCHCTVILYIYIYIYIYMSYIVQPIYTSYKLYAIYTNITNILIIIMYLTHRKLHTVDMQSPLRLVTAYFSYKIL